MNWQELKNSAKRIITGHQPSIYFYSQGGEDAILKCIFRKKLLNGEKGFYVDVGAYHPFYASNTYMFYVGGWRGINIDARPGSMDAFHKIRPKDINLEIGIGAKEDVLTYHIIDNKSTMNSFSKEFLVKTGMAHLITKEVPVKVYALHSILSQYESLFNKIDILNIDAEGLDLQIIQSNNWEKYRPSVIIIELSCVTVDDIIENEITKYLCSKEYRVIAKNVITHNVASVFFADKYFDY